MADRGGSYSILIYDYNTTLINTTGLNVIDVDIINMLRTYMCIFTYTFTRVNSIYIYIYIYILYVHTFSIVSFYRAVHSKSFPPFFIEASQVRNLATFWHLGASGFLHNI